MRWFGWNNFYYFMKDPFFLKNLINTLLLVGGVIVATVIGGIALALLLDQPFWGRGIVRILMIIALLHHADRLVDGVEEPDHASGFRPFCRNSALVRSDAAARLVRGAAAFLRRRHRRLAMAALLGADPADSAAIARRGAEGRRRNGWRTLTGHISGISFCPHLARPITVVILIQMIFLLNIFAEIKVTSTGSFAGNLTYLVFSQLNNSNDIGAAAAGRHHRGDPCNIVAIFLVRLVGKNLEN